MSGTLSRLHALWRRRWHCRRGVHREAIHPDPLILSWRCVDCGLQRAIGWVFHDSNALHPHHPWEGDDR